MKNYKFLIPVLLVGFYVLSLFTLMDAKKSSSEEYQSLIAEARAYRQQDIQVDAFASYQKALNHTPSVELCVEIGEYYKEIGRVSDAIDWGEEIVAMYPKEVLGYEFLMGMHESVADIAACYSVADMAERRGLSSPRINELLEKHAYSFYLVGEYTDVSVYSGYLCAVMKGNKWGYVNETGTMAVYYSYAYAGPFSGDLAPVVDENGAAYFIDTSGNKKKVAQGAENATLLGLIEEGVYSAYDGSSWSFYGPDEKFLIGPFVNASNVGNYAIAAETDGAWHLYDNTGKKRTEQSYEDVIVDEKSVAYRNGRFFVKTGQGYQMVDAHGTVCSAEYYEDAKLFSDTSYAAVKKNGKWSFINAAGEKLNVGEYEDARSFCRGLAAVKVGDMWGYINMDGTMVIPPQFVMAKDFNAQGCAFVHTGDSWQLLKLYKYNY